MTGWAFLLVGYLFSLLGLPGPLLMIFGILCWIMTTTSMNYSIMSLSVFIILLLLAEAAEQLGGLIGMSVSGIGKAGWWGTLIGMGLAFLPAILTFNPLWFLIGMVIGGIAGELYRGASLGESMKTLLGFLLGKAGGYTVKVLICTITLFYLALTSGLHHLGL